MLIERAREEDITILKLPPYVMEKIQPLDVSGFGLLKRAWTELLKETMEVLGPIESISKSTFVSVLSQVCLSETNIINGFKATRIFPINRLKYKI